MNRRAWRQPTTNEAAFKRAAGRRRYNKQRQLKAKARRALLVKQFGWRALLMVRGTKSLAAATLGVHPATIGRDVDRLLVEERPNQAKLVEKITRWIEKRERRI
jgi:hypothetical protein